MISDISFLPVHLFVLFSANPALPLDVLAPIVVHGLAVVADQRWQRGGAIFDITGLLGEEGFQKVNDPTPTTKTVVTTQTTSICNQRANHSIVRQDVYSLFLILEGL